MAIDAPVAPSGDDVWRELVFEPRQLVAQQELSFLEPLQLQLVGLPRSPERLDRRVEVAMLLAQPLELSDQPRAFLRREPLFVHSYPTLRQAFRALNARRAASTPSAAPRVGQFNASLGLLPPGRLKWRNLPQKCRGFGFSIFTTWRHFAALASVAGYVVANFVAKNMRGDIPMSIDSHLSELVRRHQAIEESLILAEVNHPKARRHQGSTNSNARNFI